jgi:hypothetical protein
MKSRRKILLVTFLGCAAAAVVFHERVGIAVGMVTNRFSKKSIADRLREFGAVARQRMKADFSKAGVAYPPRRTTLLVLKAERRLEVYAGVSNGLRFIRAYPVLAASGGPGPKLREGDRQVPEGVYGIELLNPNSAYHVSLRLDYPNAFDRAQAKNDGRSTLGGDIMIHGKSVSIGCIAVGDEAAEEVFTLAADSGIKNVAIICSPLDLRKQDAPSGPGLPAWSRELYGQIKSELAQLPAPPK